jgi:subtilase family serine protease
MRKFPPIKVSPAQSGISWVSPPWKGGDPVPIASPLATLASAPYTPSQLRHAYGVDRLNLNGAGQTIAIVTAYDSPTIFVDVNTFSLAFGLPPANLVKTVPASGTPRFDAGWAFETALDVEWAHAIAPAARILLVEAASSSLTDLLTAANYAVSQGASVVSMSWGTSEFWWQSYYDANFTQPGITFLASAGDGGAAALYPASSPNVTAVGGTSLQLDVNGSRVSEAAWSGSGGATSTYEAKPGYQSGFLAGQGRGVPDVAYNADPNKGVYVYTTSLLGSWYAMNGTSAGPPQWAGLIALANQGRAGLGKPSLGTGSYYGTNPVLYNLAGGTSYTNTSGDFADITSGSNGYPATAGFDLVTGLGVPVADRLVNDLINA